MHRRGSKSIVLTGSLLAMLLGTSPAFSFTNAAKKPVAKPPVRKQRAAKTNATQAPPSARVLRPAELPPSAPQVTYGDRELTIVAENSTLADVLNAVRRATRSVIDVPASASRERVFVRIGPAAPSAVLAKLLEGSNYDYLILSANDDPGSVQRVVLTTRRSEGIAGPVAGPVPPPQALATDDAAPEEPAQVETAPEEQNNVPDSGAQEAPQPEPPAQAEPQPPNNGVKTPEQLLEELRRMQQQQQQQNQNPTNEN